MSTALNAGREVSALITKTALEQYFWSRPDANEGHVLRIFADGRHRIAAVTRRLALRRGSTKVRLDEQDF